MKLSLSFLVFVALIQFVYSNVLSKSGIQEQLLSDATAVQNGSDVIMAKPGPLDIILVELVFEVCSTKCTADFLVCYEPHPSDKNVLEDNCDKKYGFCITTIGGKISFMKLILHGSPVTCKSDLCFEVKMKNSAISVLSSDGEIAETTTYAPKVKNGVVKLNIINATSECSVSIKNAIIMPETTTAPLTTTTLGPHDQTSSGKNEHASAATTNEPESFFADYWWIFLILSIFLSAIEIGIGVYYFLRRKRQKLIPVRRRKLQCSEFPVVLQPTTETQKSKTEGAFLSDSVVQQSSILSHKSLLCSKKEAPKKEKSMPLSNGKQQLLHQQQHHLDNLIDLHMVIMNVYYPQPLQPMNLEASLLIIGGFF